MMEEEIILKKLMQYAKGETQIIQGAEMNDNIDTVDEEFNNEFQQMLNSQNNPSYRPLQRKSGFVGYIRYLFKRAVRKYTRFYVDPISLQQTQYNFANTKVVGILNKKNAEIKKSCEENVIEQNKKIIELQESDNEVFQLLEEKNHMIALLSNKIDSLEDKVNLLEQTGIFSNITKNEWITTTYSQAGEDVIIMYILQVIGMKFRNVTYLDLGANHAKELSNTYALYCKGARGVLVEANPKLIPELKLNRSEDVIINKCVSGNSEATLKFYIMSGDGLSTSDYDSVKAVMEKNPNISIADIVEVESISIKDIFHRYFADSPTVLNIDIEGQEMSILQQIDFNKCRPTIIVIEVIEYSCFINKAQKNEDIIAYIKDKGYIEYAFTGINSIFVDENVWK